MFPFCPLTTATTHLLMSDLSPRPRPGYETPAAPLLTTALFASLLRTFVGVFCLGIALLWFPGQMWTPILSGVSILMVVNGALAVWKCVRRAEAHKVFSLVLVWGPVVVALGIIGFAMVFGPGRLGPYYD